VIFFFFFGGGGTWASIQGLHLEPLHQPFFCGGFFDELFAEGLMMNYLPRLASNCDPPESLGLQA
jgi:hypothetical protein